MRTVSLTAAMTLAFTVTACSNDSADKQLPPGDTAVCNAAHTKNTRTVYNVRNQPTDPTLKKHANRIYPGSKTSSDTDAINNINDRCEELGYKAP